MLRQPGLKFTVPTNSSLVGGVFATQCLQTSLNKTCVLVTGALRVQIMR